jgi:hypothetical protein
VRASRVLNTRFLIPLAGLILPLSTELAAQLVLRAAGARPAAVPALINGHSSTAVKRQKMQ